MSDRGLLGSCFAKRSSPLLCRHGVRCRLGEPAGGWFEGDVAGRAQTIVVRLQCDLESGRARTTSVQRRIFMLCLTNHLRLESHRLGMTVVVAVSG